MDDVGAMLAFLEQQNEVKGVQSAATATARADPMPSQPLRVMQTRSPLVHSTGPGFVSGESASVVGQGER
jgi:hypothetical protein